MLHTVLVLRGAYKGDSMYAKIHIIYERVCTLGTAKFFVYTLFLSLCENIHTTRSECIDGTPTPSNSFHTEWLFQLNYWYHTIHKHCIVSICARLLEARWYSHTDQYVLSTSIATSVSMESGQRHRCASAVFTSWVIRAILLNKILMYIYNMVACGQVCVVMFIQDVCTTKPQLLCIALLAVASWTKTAVLLLHS